MLLLHLTSSLNQQTPQQTVHGANAPGLCSHTYAMCSLPQNQEFIAPGYPQATVAHKERCSDRTHTAIKDVCKL
eukprot:1151172-Pelagomonas_calceolata.AAC.1